MCLGIFDIEMIWKPEDSFGFSSLFSSSLENAGPGLPPGGLQQKYTLNDDTFADHISTFIDG